MEREMEMLERQLAALGAAVHYPATPAMADEVMRRAVERPEATRAPAWALAATAAAAIVVLCSAIVGVVTPARDAAADIFDRINIFETDEAPAGAGSQIEGEDVSLAEAEERLEFDLFLPDSRAPASVLYQEYGLVRAAALFFTGNERGGYVLFETTDNVGKGLFPEATWEPVDGLGAEAYWLEGLRLVQYEEPDGGVIQESVRVTDANTLVWTQAEFVFRLEGDLTLDEAVTIARSLR
jgi:hypothetical protein